MAFVGRNNFIFYYGVPLTSIGDTNDVLSAVGILARYDFIVVKRHSVLSEREDLQEIIRAVRTINPEAKFFGYTTLGDAANLAAWQAQLDTWATDIPSQGMLYGIFIDKFGFDDGATATRANQNTAVTAVYAKFPTAPKLQVAVSASDPTHAIGSVDGLVEPVIATGTGVDYVVLDEFYLEAGGTPEPIERLYARISYAAAEAKAPAPAPNATILPISKLGVLLAVRTGNTATPVPLADYATIVNLAEIHSVKGLGLMPDDAGDISHRYYYRETPNDFLD